MESRYYTFKSNTTGQLGLVKDKLLPTWQKPIAWALIALALPFVCLWRVYVAAKWRLWAGRIYFPIGSLKPSSIRLPMPAIRPPKEARRG